MTVSTILISLQGLFFKNVHLWWFKKKASYTLAMTLTLSDILICLGTRPIVYKAYFSIIFATGGLRRKQVTHQVLDRHYNRADKFASVSARRLNPLSPSGIIWCRAIFKVLHFPQKDVHLI